MKKIFCSVQMYAYTTRFLCQDSETKEEWDECEVLLMSWLEILFIKYIFECLGKSYSASLAGKKRSLTEDGKQSPR